MMKEWLQNEIETNKSCVWITGVSNGNANDRRATPSTTASATAVASRASLRPSVSRLSCEPDVIHILESSPVIKHSTRLNTKTAAITIQSFNLAASSSTSRSAAGSNTFAAGSKNGDVAERSAADRGGMGGTSGSGSSSIKLEPGVVQPLPNFVAPLQLDIQDSFIDSGKQCIHNLINLYLWTTLQVYSESRWN